MTQNQSDIDFVMKYVATSFPPQIIEQNLAMQICNEIPNNLRLVGPEGRSINCEIKEENYLLGPKTPDVISGVKLFEGNKYKAYCNLLGIRTLAQNENECCGKSSECFKNYSGESDSNDNQ